MVHYAIDKMIQNYHQHQCQQNLILLIVTNFVINYLLNNLIIKKKRIKTKRLQRKKTKNRKQLMQKKTFGKDNATEREDDKMYI
jgi:uncharacterized membrane protein YciS (DUF1049 family)